MHDGELLESLESCHGVSESLIVCSLSTSSWSYNHETVAHLDCVVKLNDLIDEWLGSLVVLDTS